MKKVFTLLLLSLCFAAPVLATLPSEFYVNQRWISFSLAFDIETPNERLGSVHKRILSLRTEYDFYDFKENLQASASARWLSWGYIFDVKDAKGAHLGSLEEQILTLLPKFKILSSEGKIQAVAKMNLVGTKFTITDPFTEEEIATMQRSFFRLKDNWQVNILRPDLFEKNQIDPRLFITAMAFQTDRESWSKHKSADFKSSPLTPEEIENYLNMLEQGSM